MAPLVKIWFAIAIALIAMVLGGRCARADALDCLADNIYYEAASEPYNGKVAVAQVTMNRALQDFNGDVCAAVYFQARNPVTGKKAAAFSWTLGTAWRPRHVDPRMHAECVWLANEMLEGRLHSVVIGEDVKFYHAVYINPHWHLRRVARIGQHIFYRSPL
jgi:N-acetylmuramoyl-L-alanine amidase